MSAALLRTALALAASAALVAAQEDVVLGQLAEARRLHEAGQDEDAALLLRPARAALASLEDAAIRRRLGRSIDALLADVDPLDTDLRKAQDAAARALLKPARAYLRRKWYRAALPVLEDAAALSADVAGKALADAREDLGAAGRAGGAEGVAGWFGKGLNFGGGGYWKVDGGVVESPALGIDSVGFRSERRTDGDVRLSIEARTSASPSKAALVFAMEPSKNGDDYYIVELRHEAGFSQLRLLHIRADGGIDELVNQPVGMSRAERAAWVELWAELRGDRIRFGVGDLEAAEARSVTPDLDGCIGLFVSGDSPFKAPVRFRNLRVEPL